MCTTTDFCTHYDRNMVPINDVGTHYDQNIVPKSLASSENNLKSRIISEADDNPCPNILLLPPSLSNSFGPLSRDDTDDNTCPNILSLSSSSSSLVLSTNSQYMVTTNFNIYDTDTDTTDPHTLMMLSCNDVKNNYQSIVATDFDVDSDIVIEFTSVHHGCALYLYVVPILYYDIQYLMGCYSINTIIYDGDNRIDSNHDDCDLVHYGVVYAYVHAYYIVQLL